MENLLVLNRDINSQVPALVDNAKLLSTEEQVFIKNISKFFINKVNAISSIFGINKDRSKANLRKDFNAFIKEIKDLDKDIKKITENKKFSEVAKIEIPTMLGYSKNMYEATAILKPVMDMIDKDLFTILDEADNVITNVMVSEDFRKSNRPFKYEINIGEFRYKLEEALEKLIDSNGTKDSKKVEELLPNLSSMHTIKNDLVEIARTASVKELEKIENKITIISERTENLYKVLSNDPEIEVTSKVINELAYRLETTAKIVTTAISLIHVYNQTAIMLKMVVERLNK
jgi:uncharacterized pyridoxamine 5'-phosphate oxidase family protein